MARHRPVFDLGGTSPGADPGAGQPAPMSPDRPGFWLGLWQGIIVPITWVISLFSDTVSIFRT